MTVYEMGYVAKYFMDSIEAGKVPVAEFDWLMCRLEDYVRQERGIKDQKPSFDDIKAVCKKIHQNFYTYSDTVEGIMASSVIRVLEEICKYDDESDIKFNGFKATWEYFKNLAHHFLCVKTGTKILELTADPTSVENAWFDVDRNMSEIILRFEDDDSAIKYLEENYNVPVCNGSGSTIGKALADRIRR